MAWEIINNKPVIFDCQTGKMYKNAFDLDSAVGKYIKKAGFTRLDNIDLNEDFLLRWLRNA